MVVQNLLMVKQKNRCFSSLKISTFHTTPPPSTCDVKFAYRQAWKHPTSDLSVYKLYTLVLELSPLARDDHHANHKKCDKPNGTATQSQPGGGTQDSARRFPTISIGGG